MLSNCKDKRIYITGIKRLAKLISIPKNLYKSTNLTLLKKSLIKLIKTSTKSYEQKFTEISSNIFCNM